MLFLEQDAGQTLVFETERRRLGIHRLLSLLPYLRSPSTQSRLRTHSSRSPASSRDAARRRPCLRASDARVNVERVHPKREHRRAIAVAPIMPNGGMFAREPHHAANRADALRFGGNPRPRASSRRGGPRHRAEDLPQHRIATDKGQTAEAHVSARALLALRDFAVQLRLELCGAESPDDFWPHELERQSFRRF